MILSPVNSARSFSKALKGYLNWNRNTVTVQVVEDNVRVWKFVTHAVHSERYGPIGVHYKAPVAKTGMEALLRNRFP